MTALAFAVAAAVALVSLPGLDDEGYLTFIGAKTLDVAPLATLFFQKFHPLLSVVYAPVALLGWWPFLVAHAAVAACGVYFVGAAVQNLGGRGWLASALVATSPIFLMAAVSGQSDTDGVVALALVLYLHARGGRAASAAAVVAGACLWTRYEFSIPLAFIVLDGAIHGGRWVGVRRAALALVFPVLYGLAGAVYHHDVWWLLQYPPNLTRPVVESAAYHFLSFNWRTVAEWWLGLTLAVPCWPGVMAVRYRRLPQTGRMLGISAAVLVVPLVVLPLFHMVFEGLGPRYMLVFLPIVAACISLDPGVRIRRTGSVVAVTGAVAWITLPALPRRVRALLGAAAAPSLYATVDHLERESHHGVVYTNDRQLAVLLRWSHPEIRGVLLPQHDVLIEVYLLANHSNGQYSSLIKALGSTLYGGAMWPCAMGVVGDNDRFVLDRDVRLHVLYPETYWDAYTQLELRVGDFSIRRPRANVTRMPPPPRPSGVPVAPLVAPCR